MTLQQLETLTVQWSHDRGITTNGKSTTQMCKLMSEFGELCGNLHEGKDIKDDIGDMMVVFTNISRLMDLGILEDCKPNFEDTREGILILGKYLGDLADNIIKDEKEDARTNIGNCIYQLIILATYVCQTDLAECWEIAYNDIKDRKGFLTPDGTFIKDSDPAYFSLAYQGKPL